MKNLILLPAKHMIELTPTAPFHFDATLFKPDHFPTADHHWEPGVRWQTMLWQNQPLGLKLENRGSIDQPHVTLSIWSTSELDPGSLDRLVEEITYRYNLCLDLTGFYNRCADDPQLGPLLQRWRGMRPVNFNSLYER